MMKKPHILAIVGPTAVGKTSYGIALAQKIGGEIVSADSRQVYRGLDLGTGKVTPEEMQDVPHHLIDVADPSVQYTVADFVRDGRVAIANILTRGKVPIIVGGTGLYIDALVGRIGITESTVDETLRAELTALSLTELQDRLRTKDPARFATIDAKNPRRLVRALELAYEHGHVPVTAPDSPYDVEWIGLALPLPDLKARIHTRLIERLNAGMLDEARTLHAHGLSYARMEALGLEYRYMARHLQGLIAYDDMALQLESEIYKYAKRQLTWFKKNTNIVWR